MIYIDVTQFYIRQIIDTTNFILHKLDGEFKMISVTVWGYIEIGQFGTLKITDNYMLPIFKLDNFVQII